MLVFVFQNKKRLFLLNSYNKHFFYFLFSILFFTLTGCAVGPDFKAPAAPQTQQYENTKLPQKTAAALGNKSADQAQIFNLQARIPEDWWRLFRSEQINGFVKMGLSNNPSLAAARSTLEEAQATLQAETGDLLFPVVDLTGYGSRVRASGLAIGQTDPNRIFNLYNTVANMTYTLDIFGKNRRTIEGYQAQVDYEQYEWAGAYLSLTSNIVSTSIAIATLQDQIHITEALVRAQTAQLKISHRQYLEGGVSKAMLASQAQQLADAQATLPPLKKALTEQTHALAVLVGRYTSEQAVPHLSLDTLRLPTDLPLSLPSQMVQQRPDVQAATALLHVASANIGVATANLLPDITLSAQYGWLSQTSSQLFSKANNIWNAEAGFAQPAFHAGALWYARKATLAAYQTARYNYQQTVLNAFADVANALTAVSRDAETYQKDVLAEKAVSAQYTIAKNSYRVGGTTYLAVLDAEIAYRESELTLIKAKAARYADTVALYQSLGGGWWYTVSKN